MAINSLRLQNFRSYGDDSFEFEHGVNIIVGPNASGKTNLLEAIMLSCRGKSYRGRDVELVAHGHDWARIDTFGDKADKRAIKLQDADKKIKKIIEIDDKQYVRMPNQKKLPFVLFEPNHLLMFHGGPEQRREFIDNLLEQTKPEFSNTRKHYKRALAQRNSLLKSGRANKDELFVWSLRLSDLGGVIVTERLQLLKTLNKQLPGIYEQLSGTKSSIRATYVSECREDSYATDLLKKLEQNIPQEVARGFTVFGPHRDDIEFSLNKHSVKESASRGEVRTIVLALKIFEQTQIENITSTKPLFLLDDVFSELDGARRRHLTEFLKSHQVFITTTDADVVVQHFSDKNKVIALTRPEN